MFCATSVKIFDIRKSTPTSSNENSEYSCQSLATYTIAYEDVVIKSGTLVPLSEQRHSGLQNNETELRTKIAILFDTGRLQLINLNIDKYTFECLRSIIYIFLFLITALTQGRSGPILVFTDKL